MHMTRRPWMRKLLWVMAGCVVVAAILFNAWQALQESRLPKVPLTSLDGQSTSILAMAGGKPFVVNLWATWCPPCRAEMPVLSQAQQHEPGISFIFLNQGESGVTVQQYLAVHGLVISNVVIDLGARFGREVGSMGLPTTLFYDAQGRMVDTQVGGLSTASLESKLAKLRAASR